jgi:tetratricopeptide (TPR) repeat protein
MMNHIEQLLELLQDAPDDCFLKHALALEYVKLNAFEKARQLFEENQTFDPGYVATYYHLGQLLEKMNLPEAALAVYEEGMQQAKMQGEEHAYRELRSVQEELLF